MTDHSKRVCEILEAAVELPRDQLSAFLERACGSDVALRGEIEELLHFLASAPTHFLEPPAPPDPDSESQLGEFVLLHKLGQGGMGVVYLARQESLGREVAVKVLTVGPGTPASFVERFHRESRAAAKLNHDGIARVFVDGRDGVDHWFAMEFVPGHDLSRELDLQRGRENGVPILPDPSDPEHGPSVARLVAGVADALAYAHCRGIIHRDIKPQNLLLTPDGVVKVADFGLARDQSLDSLTRGEVMGSVHYMSPERLGDEGSFDHRADIYSLGVVLYEMLTLDRPFEGRTTDDVILKIREQEPRSVRARNPRVSRDLAVLCHKAMSKDPERRFADAGLLASELRRVAAGLPIETRPPSMSERAGRWAWRHRVLLGAGAVFGVALWVLWFFVLRPPTAVMSLEGAGIAGARASVYPIKPVGWVVGERREIGLCPCEVDLPLGYYRFVLESERGFAELTRWLATPGQRYVAGDHVRLRPSDEVHDGMAEVAGGSFMFGWEEATNIDHRPRVQHVESFWIDKTEVSNGDYREFLADTGRAAPGFWPASDWQPEWDVLPVAAVTLEDARAYAEWAGKRLASDREWERAARGTEGWLLPWRPDLDRDDVLAKAVVARGPLVKADEAGGWASYLAGVEPVDSRDQGRNELGMYHLVGNLHEWTETVATSVVDGRVVASHGNYRVKGCDFTDVDREWPVNRTFWTPATVTEDRYGFRCAKSARP